MAHHGRPLLHLGAFVFGDDVGLAIKLDRHALLKFSIAYGHVTRPFFER